MTRVDFEKFIDKTLNEIILFTELHTKESNLKEIEFQWLTKESPVFKDRQEIINAIAAKVYIDVDKIYPCVDLQVLEIRANTIVLKAWIANFDPRPFGKGWSNRPGPFIYLINAAIIHPSVNTKSKEFREVLRKNGLLHYD
jgi:hypothetical protein